MVWIWGGDEAVGTFCRHLVSERAEAIEKLIKKKDHLLRYFDYPISWRDQSVD